MHSPFPGMDPYLESQGYWQDFHTSFLTYSRKALTAALPKHYAALIEERISLVDLSGESTQFYRPDIGIVHESGSRLPQGDRGVQATLEPISIPLALEALEEVHQRWIEIRKLPDRSLVTVIELLSPSNKIGSGRSEYIEKRNQWIKQPVHMVEIDLLLSGHRLPMKGPLPTADYYAFVLRFNRRPIGEVYPWSIRRELPTIPIPLVSPDPDVNLDLAAVFGETYGDARYGELVRYAAPLDLPLAPDDRDWAEHLAP